MENSNWNINNHSIYKIHQIPPELLITIFPFIGNEKIIKQTISCICRKFYSITCTEEFRRYLCKNLMCSGRKVEYLNNSLEAICENLPNIHTVQFYHNYIDTDDFMKIEQYLPNNTFIHELYMFGICIRNNFSCIANGLKYNQSIHTLRINWAKINEDSLINIADIIVHNTNIIKLELLDNQLSANSIDRIAEALAKNTTLEYLDLSFNNIGTNGAIAIANSLVENNRLKTFILRGIQCRPEFGTVLGNILKSNTTLIKLNLFNNMLGSIGIIDLMEGLIQNTTLKSLNIDYNKVNNDAEERIVRAIILNKSLRNIECFGNQITRESYKYLKQMKPNCKISI
jgi:Ran GTPase-activating protein (RanGAP) involved in mRNA processing and transport